MNSLNFYLSLIFLIFFAFSIGLNLGFYGVISIGSFHKFNPKDYSSNSYSVTHLDTDQNVKYTDRITKDLDQNVKNTDQITKDLDQISKNSSIPTLYVKNVVVDLPIQLPPSMSYDEEIHKTLSDIPKYKDIILPKQLNQAVLSSAQTYSHSLPGPIESFIKGGGRIPIALLTYNRFESLKNTIKSILNVKGVLSSDLIICQDGNLKEVAEIANQNRIQLVQNLEGLHLRGAQHADGASRIARHYKYSLSADFLEYFQSVAPLLEKDSSVFIASAWNDNGFAGKVRDVHAVRRTDFFPGLGWLLPRKLYVEELEPQWPDNHWDHWLRSPAINKNREIVYPQVPRSFHNGIIGTFMDLNTHNRYFRDIAYNQLLNVSWKAFDFIQAEKGVYEERIKEILNHCVHVKTLQQLNSSPEEKVYCIWINVNPEVNSYGFQEFERIGGYFGIWHEHKRGGHKGLHEFYWKNRYIMLLNIYNNNRSYKSSMPADASIMRREDFL